MIHKVGLKLRRKMAFVIAMATSLVVFGALASSAFAITGWTNNVDAPANDGVGDYVFSGLAYANNGNSAWGDMSTFPQINEGSGWSSYGNVCDPSSCGNTEKDNIFGATYSQGSIYCTYSYRTLTITSVLLTGGWQYQDLYSGSVKFC